MLAAVRRNLTFVPSEKMVEGRATTVIADLANQGSSVSSDFVGSVTTVEPVSTTCDVQAELSGSGFTVEPPGEWVRSFLSQPKVQWSWSVTPSEAGKLTLNLDVQSVTVFAGAQLVDDFGNKPAAIDVVSGKSGASSFWSFLNGPLIGGVVAGLLVLAIGGGVTGIWKRLGAWIKRKVRPTPAKKEPTSAVQSRDSDAHEGV